MSVFGRGSYLPLDTRHLLGRLVRLRRCRLRLEEKSQQLPAGTDYIRDDLCYFHRFAVFASRRTSRMRSVPVAIRVCRGSATV